MRLVRIAAAPNGPRQDQPPDPEPRFGADRLGIRTERGGIFT